MDTKRYDFVLLMTACIQPKPTTNSAFRRDSTLRLTDYQNALRFWLDYPDKRIGAIIFTDNSGYDLSSLRVLAKNNRFQREVEFIQVQEPDLPMVNGYSNYGYGESDILDRTWELSQILPVSRYVIKTTGRLIFPNLSKLLTTLPAAAEIMIDARVFPRPYLTTTLFVVSYDFYKKYLAETKEQMKIPPDGIGLEECYYRILRPLYDRDGEHVFFRFPVNVPPVGIGSHSNKNYNAGIWPFLEFVRAIFRKTMPFIWF